MPVRLLKVELQKKAEEELNEVPSQVQENLDHMREWLSKQPHLKARTDDQWLLAFLRGCKFSLERTKQKMDLFYSVRKLVPEFFANRDPLLPEIQEVLNEGIFTGLSKKDPSGPAILVSRSINPLYPDKISATALMKVLLMVLEITYLEDDNCTVVGQCAIFDLKNMSYKYAAQLTPSFAKKAIMCVEDVYPTRVKGIHFVNTPVFFVAAYNAFKFLLTAKLRNRINFYTAANIASVYNAIPALISSKEYGGEDNSHAETAAQLKLKVESYRDWFLEDAQYCTDETKRLGKPMTSEDMFGLEGSFRKLNLD